MGKHLMFAHDSYLMTYCQAQINRARCSETDSGEDPAPMPSLRLHPLISSVTNRSDGSTPPPHDLAAPPSATLGGRASWRRLTVAFRC